MKRFYQVTLLAKAPDGTPTYQATHGWITALEAVYDDEALYTKVIGEGCASFRRWGFTPEPGDIVVMNYYVGELREE